MYYNPSHLAGFSGSTTLIEAVKNKIYEQKAVKGWLQSQDTYTLHKPVRKRFLRNKYIVYRINELWQCDLNDLRGISKYNNGYNYTLTVIDVFSKILYARVLKQKTPSEVIDAFKSIFKESQSKPKTYSQTRGQSLQVRR